MPSWLSPRAGEAQAAHGGAAGGDRQHRAAAAALDVRLAAAVERHRPGMVAGPA